MSVRQRKEVLEKLKDHFVEYNLPKEITIHGYMQIVAQPVLRRAIKKNFRTWPRTLRALEIAYPELFSKAESVVEKEDPLSALAKAKAAKAELEKVNEDE